MSFKNFSNLSQVIGCNKLWLLIHLRNRFTPKNSLQERNESFIQYYAVYGENFMKMLKDNLNPLDNNFLFLETDD